MEFDLRQIALTLEAIGTLMIAWATLAVHHTVRMESKIDRKVKKLIHKEEIIVISGALTILVSYIIQVWFLE